MVRLKPGKIQNIADIIRNFTFHYGTIKTIVQLIDDGNKVRFTFHYGTIKTGVFSVQPRRLSDFTFHYGTI